MPHQHHHSRFCLRESFARPWAFALARPWPAISVSRASFARPCLKALACNVEPTGGAARIEDGCRSPLPPRGSATAAPAANGQAASASLERGGATVAPAAQRVRAGPHPELSLQLWEGASAANAVVRRYVLAPLPWPSLAAAAWPSLAAAASPSAASQGAASPHCCPTLTFHFILQI